VDTKGASEEEVYRFLYDKIDSVPHLEALLLLWNDRPRRWSKDELGRRLFLTDATLGEIMEDLVRLELAVTGGDQVNWYAYQAGSPRTDRLIEGLAETYKRDLMRVTREIHSKTSSGAREFGRAFKFRKDRK
jgi:hypothetical protein